MAKALLMGIALVALLSASDREEQPEFLGRQEAWDYAPAMKEVARRFSGVEGVVLHLGDSITFASPYTSWAREGRGKTPEDEAVLRWSHCGEANDRDGWYLAHHDVNESRSFTAAGGITAQLYLTGGYHGLPSLEEIVRRYRPQIAIVMLGTNDAWQGRPTADYARDMEAIVTHLLAQGAIPILSTIPPIIAKPDAAEAYNQALWRIAEAHRLPVIDYYGEILARRPGTSWDGTLLNKGDVHPTASRAGVTPESEPTPAHLRESGYLLRGWLSVRKLAEVKRRVLDEESD